MTKLHFVAAAAGLALLGGYSAKANLLLNGNLDQTHAAEIVPGFFLPQPDNWSVESFRTITGPYNDAVNSEPWAGPAPTPVTTDGALNGPSPDGYNGLDGGVFFKPFSGNTTNGAATGHMIQTVPGQPGVNYIFTGWAGAESNYVAAGVSFRVEFLSAANAVIGSHFLDLKPTLTTPNGQAFNYKQYTIEATSPPFTASVRVTVSMVDGQPNPAGGGQAIVFDDFELTAEVPEGELNLGESVANLSGATVSAIYPGVMAPDDTAYLRAKVKGIGITSANDECILAWNGDEATVRIREGTALPEGTIRSFGDPIYHDGLLTVSAKLVLGGSVTALNDDVLLTMNAAAGPISLRLREGAPVGLPAGFSIYRLDWIHPVDGGIFAGVTLANAGAVEKRGALLELGSGTVAAFVGGPVEVDDVSKVIKTIGKPTAKKPASYQTRVGNDSSVSVLIKTTTGETLLKKFKTVAE